MKDKQKALLAKASVILTGILLVILIIMLVRLKTPESNPNYATDEKITLVVLLVSFVSGSIMMFLMTHTNIQPEKTKSKELKVKKLKYEELKEKLEAEFIKDGYLKLEEYHDYPYQTLYTYKKKGEYVDFVILIKAKEFTEEMYQEYETRFEQLQNALIKKGYFKERDSLFITTIICVDQTTKYFSEYIEKNVTQYSRRYVLPVGVSLDSNMLYIVTQKEGMFKSAYNKMKKRFGKYIIEIIEENQK